MKLTLVLATGNRHKVGELTAILAAAQVPVEVRPPFVVGGMPEVVEDADTFEGNARKKALALISRLRDADPEMHRYGKRRKRCIVG